MAITTADTEALRKELTVNAAIAAAVTGVPLLQNMRGASNADEQGMGGYYDTDDNYVGYWRVGEELGSAPLKD